MTRGRISIIKSSGAREPWNKAKLERSLRAAKASPEVTREIVTHIAKDVADGMTTGEIYQHALALLKKYDRPRAAEYGLKKAIMNLGPSGFPFERFVSELLKAQGYRTKIGVFVKGVCVSHEVDVVAEKPDERILVEAKYHNSVAVKSDVKVALYVNARFQDITQRLETSPGGRRSYTRAWLITNTSFTSQAIQFGTCAGLALTGWNFPKGRTLQDLVQETQTHPLTCLTTLTGPQKGALLQMGAILCRDIMKDPGLLEKIGMNSARITAVLREVGALCRKNDRSLSK